jgi:hypothetical protein
LDEGIADEQDGRRVSANCPAARDTFVQWRITGTADVINDRARQRVRA